MPAIYKSKLEKLTSIEQRAYAAVQCHSFDLAILLVELHKQQLYVCKGFTSFGSYIDSAQAICGVSRRQAYRLVRGLHVLEYLKHHRQPPTSERQVSPYRTVHNMI